MSSILQEYAVAGLRGRYGRSQLKSFVTPAHNILEWAICVFKENVCAQIGLSYRALAVEDGEDTIWVWIGNHDVD